MQDEADAARLGRLRVRELELAEDLRLADHHRIEARTDAKQMADGVAAVEMVERVGERVAIDFAIGGEKFERFVGGARRVGGHADHLDAIAGRNQRGLGHRGACCFSRPSAATISSSANASRSRTATGGAAMVDAEDERAS